MEPERWLRVQEIFAAAAEVPAEAREAFLTEQAGDDDELRREVESLLAADSKSEEFLEEPALPGRISQILADGPSEKVEGRIGPYRLLRKLGEGGMSRVYLAVRDDGFQRLVALKVIRRGLKSEDLLHRFRTERQILAGLDHPNIAKLLDGGSTEDNLPYFVMEYIDGTPVDEYCDRNRLTVFQRLQIFLDICAAVQYAHQSLVVHRDIKTSNILVTADGTAKLLDFGIAKLLKPEQFPVPVELTATMMRPMTPFYASPEQIQGRTITTASDVYSLGVLLYKLLTGHLPYQVETRTAKEVEQAVVETPPERPSTAVSRVETLPGGSGADGEITITPESVSRARSVQPQQLRRILTGDLDNILLAALRKEPQRRYGTVEQFADDVRRSLDGLPVRAHKDSVGYRARKFVQRNRVPIGVVATIVALLFGFAVTMAMQASRIALERDAAQRERDRAEQVVTFLQEIFRVSDPHEGGGQTITARAILDSGAQRVRDELQGQPEVQATLMQAIGNVYRNLGLYDLAEPLLHEALNTRRRVLGNDHPAVAQSLNNLGVVLRQRGDYEGAEPLFNEALEMRRRHHADADHPDVAESLNNLALLHQERGRYPEAEKLLREAIEIQRSAGGSGVELASLLANLGILLTEVGDWTGAEPPFREALQLRREALGEDHALVADSMNDLGVFLGIQGDLESAEVLLRDALAMRRRSLDPNNPTLAESINNLGRLLREKGDFAGAEELYREAISIREKQLGRDHRLVAIHVHNLGNVLQAQGKLAQAEVQLRDSLAIRMRIFGEAHQEVGWSYVALGNVLLQQDRAPEAEALLRKGVQVLDRNLPPNHWRTAQAQSALGACLTAQARYREAEPLLLSSYELLAAKRGPNHRRTQDALDNLIELYDSTGRIAEADALRLKRVGG